MIDQALNEINAYKMGAISELADDPEFMRNADYTVAHVDKLIEMPADEVKSKFYQLLLRPTEEKEVKLTNG